MSLMIDVDRISRVLLADGWHTAKGFSLDAYEYVHWHERHDGERDFRVDFTASQAKRLVTSTGFEFTDGDGFVVAGPITSILAVMYAPTMHLAGD